MLINSKRRGDYLRPEDVAKISVRGIKRGSCIARWIPLINKADTCTKGSGHGAWKF